MSVPLDLKVTCDTKLILNIKYISLDHVDNCTRFKNSILSISFVLTGIIAREL
jgi:hypothetical protein